MSINLGSSTVGESPSYAPRATQRQIVKSSNGTLVLFANVDNIIRYKTSTNNGVSWSASWTNVFTPAVSANWNGFDVYIDGSDNIHVTWTGLNNSAQRWYYRLLSYSSGSWSLGTTRTITTASVLYPKFTIRSNGDYWVSSNTNILYSSDSGETWNAVSYPSDGSVNISTIIPVGSNIWYIVQRNGALAYYIYTSSFGSIKTIVSSGITNSSVGLGCLKISDTNIWVAGRTSSGFKIYHYTGSWDSGEVLSGNSSDYAPALGNINGNPIAVYRDYSTGSSNLGYRLYNGATWNSLVLLTDDATADFHMTVIDNDATTAYIEWVRGSGTSFDIYFEKVLVNADETLDTTDTVSIADDWLLQVNPDSQAIADTLEISDDWNLQLNPDFQNIADTITINDSWLLELSTPELDWPESINVSDTWTINTIVPTHYPTKILSYNPLIYVTDTNPATLVVVDVTDPEVPVKTVYPLTGVSNANSVSYNETNGFIYAVNDDGKVIKVDTTDFNSQTIINTLDTDNLMLSTIVSPELKLFAGTDDASGEVILIDEAEFKNINLDIRFLQEWKRNINLQINTILAKFANMDIRYIAEQTAKIGLDIRFLKYDYSVASQYPLSYLDWKVYINDVQMDTINDIDMKSIIINHNIENKSTASFILHRQHDKLNFTNTGVASEITNQNEVKIYINNVLEFDGKISNYNCSLEGEQVNITALMDTPTDDRSTVNIPLPSVNETLNLYHCLNDSVSIENPYQDERAVIVGDDGKYWAAGIWVYGIKNAMVFASDSAAEAYINATKSSVFTSKNPSVASRESAIQYYKGIKINLGTSIKENVKRYTAFTDVADAILAGTFNQQQNWDYFWKVSLRDFTQGIVEKPGFGESSFTDVRYIGTSVSPITSDTYILDSAYYSYQRIYDDTETTLGYYYIGSAPFKEISGPNGKKTVAERWEDRNDGLYRVIDDSYNYVDYCKTLAMNEYNKLTNINGDVLPITQANLTITLNGYYYYNIKLLKRINLVNTTTANIYKNLNGFPVAVKSISISSNDMKVILNCDNQKVQIELDEIDATLPDVDNYKKDGSAKRIHYKYDPIARQWVV